MTVSDDSPRLDWAAGLDIAREVHGERRRAHLKHGAKGNSREDQPWDEKEWLPILVEEVGEVAHLLTYDVITDVATTSLRAELRKELVQVAAMACAWIAAIDEATD